MICLARASAPGIRSGSASAPVPSDDISEDEFENLLNKIHGEGQGTWWVQTTKTLPRCQAPSSEPKDSACARAGWRPPRSRWHGNLALAAEPAEGPQPAAAKPAKPAKGAER